MCVCVCVCVQSQSQATEQQIRKEFEHLRAFLQREEETRLLLLQQEHEDKKLLAKKRTDNVTKDILALSHAVIAVENETAAGDALFLQVPLQALPLALFAVLGP